MGGVLDCLALTCVIIGVFYKKPRLEGPSQTKSSDERRESRRTEGKDHEPKDAGSIQ